MQKAVEILIVEDHILIAEAIREALYKNDSIKVLAIVPSIAEAKVQLQMTTPQVALVDLQLEDGDGLDLATYIISKYSNVKVVIVTAHNELRLVQKALTIGCSGYISKYESYSYVVEAIHGVLSGATVLSPKITAILTKASKTKEAKGNDAVDLTARELDVLRLLGEGLSTENMAENLFVSQNTIRNYFSKLSEKLETHSKLETVAKAMRMGLIPVPTESRGVEI